MQSGMLRFAGCIGVPSDTGRLAYRDTKPALAQIGVADNAIDGKALPRDDEY